MNLIRIATQTRQRFWIILLWSAAIALAVQAASAQTIAPTSGPASTKPAKRSNESLLEDIQKAGAQLKDVLASSAVLTDPAKRAEASPKAVPLLQMMLYVSAELATNDDAGKIAAQRLRDELLPLMATFGDATELAKIEAAAKNADADAALQAKSALMISNWFIAGNDNAAQAMVDHFTFGKASIEKRSSVMDVLLQIARAFRDDEPVWLTSLTLHDDGKGEIVGKAGDRTLILAMKGRLDKLKGISKVERFTIEQADVRGRDYSFSMSFVFKTSD